VAGGAAINRNAARFSHDIDIFHDDPDAVLREAEADAALLTAQGYTIEWERRFPTMMSAVVSKDEQSTRLDWVQDSAFRFFQPQPDPDFGFVLSAIDLATNKALAAASRREARDVVDLVQIHKNEFPLSVVIWAAVAKDAGYSPELLIGEIRRNARYRVEDFDILDSNSTLDPSEILRDLRQALDGAEVFANKMPSDQAGRVFLLGGKIVEPDPARLDQYETVDASRGGIWPQTRG
jgi:hypothetical protein